MDSRRFSRKEQEKRTKKNRGTGNFCFTSAHGFEGGNPVIDPANDVY